MNDTSKSPEKNDKKTPAERKNEIVENLEDRVSFRISVNDFSGNKVQAKKFFEHMVEQPNKSQFIKDAAVEYTLLQLENESEKINKLMDYIKLMGIDHVLESLEKNDLNAELLAEKLFKKFANAGIELTNDLKEEKKEKSGKDLSEEEFDLLKGFM